MRLSFAVLVLTFASPASGEEPKYNRQEDLIYGRKFGTALTLDVIAPKKNANGAAVIWAVSGGWVSSHGAVNPLLYQELIDRGYTVFAVVHGSQPKFSVPECVEDMQRAVRFVRHEAKRFGVDPNRIGVSGGSAGGHLSLMLGTTGADANPEAKDPVDQESSRVQAVACFFPASDFLNFGKQGQQAIGDGPLSGFKAPFDFTEYNPKTRSFDPVTDPEKRREFGKKISPVYHGPASPNCTRSTAGSRSPTEIAMMGVLSELPTV